MDADQELQRRSIENAVAHVSRIQPRSPRLSRRLEDLQKVQAEVTELWHTQYNTHSTDGRESKRLRTNLRLHHLNPISADGKVYLRGIPGIKTDLRLPAIRISDKKLIDTAKRIVNVAGIYKEAFIESGYRPDFIERAEEAITAVEANAASPRKAINKRSRATASLPDALLNGREIIKAIGRIMADEYAGDKAKLQLWKDVERLPGKVGRPKKHRPRRQPPDRGQSQSADSAK
jgi:hypothetical protein